MARFILRRTVNEDDSNQQQATALNVRPAQDDTDKIKVETNRAKVEQLEKQKASINALKRKAQDDCNKQIAVYNSQLNAIDKQISDLGGNVSTTESMFYDFSRNLYESLQPSRTDEMFSIIQLAFDSIDGLSFMPSDTRIRTFAKNVITYLNRNSWSYENNWYEIESFMRKLVSSSHISLSSNELDMFIDRFKENMMDNKMFSWVFGPDIYED